jgi:hypothetical protein
MKEEVKQAISVLNEHYKNILNNNLENQNTSPDVADALSFAIEILRNIEDIESGLPDEFKEDEIIKSEKGGYVFLAIPDSMYDNLVIMEKILP